MSSTSRTSSPLAIPTSATAPAASPKDAADTTLNAPPTAASMPIELRLRALEARVLGVPLSQVQSRDLGVEDDDERETLMRRVAAASRAVEDAVGQAPQLRALYERYDTYAPLLRVGLDDPPSNTEEQVTHADVLPPQAKAAMVLEARGDLLDAERGLREIEVLEKRGVAGAGTLEDLVALAPALDTGRAQLRARKRTLAETRRDVASLVERYSEFTTTVSDMFVVLHDHVTALEEAVARAERRKINAKAETY